MEDHLIYAIFRTVNKLFHLDNVSVYDLSILSLIFKPDTLN